MLAAGKGGVAGAPADAGGGAREQDGAAAARQHHLGHLAAHEETGERAHLPHFEVDARGSFADREAHVAADVERGHLDGALLALDGLHQGDHLLLPSRVGAKGARAPAFGLDAGDQRSQLIGVAARDAGGEALAGKAAGDSAARGIAGTDDEDNLPVRHAGPKLRACRAVRSHDPACHAAGGSSTSHYHSRRDVRAKT